MTPFIQASNPTPRDLDAALDAAFGAIYGARWGEVMARREDARRRGIRPGPTPEPVVIGPHRFASVKDLAAFIGMNEHTVRRALKAGQTGRIAGKIRRAIAKQREQERMQQK